MSAPLLATNGLSGASVTVTRNARGAWVVRKSATQGHPAERLIRQMERQQAFAERSIGSIRVPRVLDSGVAGDCVYFDMELIRGVDAATALREGDLVSVKALTRVFCDYLAEAAREPALVDETECDLFGALFDRVCKVQSQTSALDDRLLGKLLWQLSRLRRLGPLGSTLCHGDMTLENLIVADGGPVWAVDLLDGPVEHWWQDVAKMDQDLSGGWFLRRHRGISPAVLEFVRSQIHRCARAITPEFDEAHAALLSCTFVRILPYVREDADREFVLSRVRHFVSEEATL